MEEEFRRLTSLEEMKRHEASILIDNVSSLLREEPSSIRIESRNVAFVGDTHGDLLTSVYVAKRYLDHGWLVIFLGDYVDRGLYQIANLNFLLQQKESHPKRLVLLRGNHETKDSNIHYGFFGRVKATYGSSFYSNYEKLFSNLSYSAIVNGKFLAVHGGLARQLRTIADLERLPKHQYSLDPICFELLWNDPNEFIEGFETNDRGPGTYYFGPDVLDEFLDGNGLKAMIRSHEPRPNGYSVGMRGRLHTVFSCRFYGVSPTVLELSENRLSPARL